MEGWEVIQECQLLPDTFDQSKLVEMLAALPAEQFNRFCKEYMHLRLFYATNRGWATDMIEHVKKYPDIFWEIESVDFDAPVNFRKIQ